MAKAKSLTDAVKNTVVGKITVPQILRTNNDAGESALGDVIADSQLAATSSATTGNAVIALMNPGGIRADLPDSTNVKPDNSVNFGDAFTVQPFGNTLTTVTLTGDQLKAVLEQQFDNPAAGPEPDLAGQQRLHLQLDGVGRQGQQGQRPDAERRGHLADRHLSRDGQQFPGRRRRTASRC